MPENNSDNRDQEGSEIPVSTRLKLRLFPGAGYDHTSVTASRKKGEVVEAIHFIVYPASHDINSAEKEAERTTESGFLDSDASDPTPIIMNNAAVVLSALSNDVLVLSKEEEQDYCHGVHHDKVVIQIPDDKFDDLKQLHEDLKAGKYGYSVVDGGGATRVHCGTVAQKVLDTALADTPFAQDVKRSDLEAFLTTNPTSVFERAKKAAAHQRHAENDDAVEEPTNYSDDSVSPVPSSWSLPSVASITSCVSSFFSALKVEGDSTTKASDSHGYDSSDDDSRYDTFFVKADDIAAASVPEVTIASEQMSPHTDSDSDEMDKRIEGMMYLDCGF